jgi:hypothetical protein
LAQELFFGVAIPQRIAINLVAPKRRIALGPLEVLARMAMPEAAMNEDNSSTCRENEIRSARQSCTTESISKALGVKGLAEEQFWNGVLSSNARHHPAARLTIYYVGH